MLLLVINVTKVLLHNLMVLNSFMFSLVACAVCHRVALSINIPVWMDDVVCGVS